MGRIFFSIIFLLLFCLPAFSVEAPVTPLFEVPRLSTITVDGAADDWGAQGLRLDMWCFDTAMPSDPENFAPAARIGWNDEGLLVVVAVKDDEFIEREDDMMFWKHDSVELCIYDKQGSVDFLYVIVSPGMAREFPELRYHIYDERKTVAVKRQPLEFVAKRTATADGYVMEVLMPWRSLGITPAVGLEIPFQIQVNELDDGSSPVHARWYPQDGAYGSSQFTYRLCLSEKTGSSVRVGASAANANFSYIRVNVYATKELQGKAVHLLEDGREVALGRLAPRADLAVAVLSIPASDPEKVFGRVTAVVDGQAPVVVVMPDMAGERRNALATAPFRFDPYVFSGSTFPSGDFEQPAMMENILGRYAIHIRFYDADYQAVTMAKKPGRYGAIVEARPERGGNAIRRFVTLFRMPGTIDWLEDEGLGAFASMPLPEALGVNPAVVRTNARSGRVFSREVLLSSLAWNPQTAVLLAAMYEAKDGGDIDRWRNSAGTRDLNWWHGLKKATGILEPYFRKVHVPDGYGNEPAKSYPLIVALHGSGERDVSDEEIGRHFGECGLLALTKTQYPAIVATPHCPPNESWQPIQLDEMIDELQRQYRIDPERIYITGYSMGGYGTFRYATCYPERVAAIAPICGGGDPEDAARLREVSVWAFHGDRDLLVVPDESREMVEAIVKAGGKAKLTIYPDAGHEIWFRTFDDPKLYEWFFQHKRAQRKR